MSAFERNLEQITHVKRTITKRTMPKTSMKRAETIMIKTKMMRSVMRATSAPDSKLCKLRPSNQQRSTIPIGHQKTLCS